MKCFLLGIMLCASVYKTMAQHSFKAAILSATDKTPLAGATITWKDQNKSTVADNNGSVTITNIPPGNQTFIISFIGFETKTVNHIFPISDSASIVVELEEEDNDHEEEVEITATRISRAIANIPTRIEVISGEELMEKSNMKPGDIRMVLNESTGIQAQQTSATSFNSGIRIQGLDGRYTQMLRDGYPLYSGFSGGLSLLQIAPLDLKQVEVIKGSSSTLYGGGAIAGLINLVSRTPGQERELNFLTNVTSARGLDLSGFYSERYGKMGLTVFGSRNSGAAYDPAGIGLTAIPKFERYTINPRVFIYGRNTTVDMGLSYITEDRIGGDIGYIRNGGNGFYERNNTDRVTMQFGIAHRLNERSSLHFKNSYSRFDRSVIIPDYQFDALQQSSFSELTWDRKGGKSDWVIGANFLMDDLRENRKSADPQRDYRYATIGVFVQNTWSVSEQFVLEAGLRGDYINEYGFEALPRLSVMYKINRRLTTRLGGGFGYKSPTIFTEEAERRQFRRILPVDINNARNERSVGGNWDINYRTTIGEVGVSLNHLFFYTRLNRPIVLINTGNNNMQFENSNGYMDTKGMETNLRLTYGDFKLFVGYTYTDAHTHFGDKQWLPLTARHRLNNVLMYELEEKLKIGLEAYYYSRQQLSDGSFGQSYWIAGLMAEKFWEKISVFLNFENFTDTRQTRFGPIYTGSVGNPVFGDIYAPLDGFVINGGVKIRL